MTGLDNPSLTVALALGVGTLAQVVARHLRVPGIVLLLATGVLLGPDVGDLIRPSTLGGGMRILVGFAVAVILFEGGLSLNLRRLRREARGIRRIVTLGALITTVGGTLTARQCLGWEWGVSILFGTLVIVTGPTVVTPILRRVRVRRRVATLLEAEGVLGDAIGAIMAVVALEVVTSPGAEVSVLNGVWSAVATLGGGALIGVLGGFLIVGLLQGPIIPEEHRNITTLALVLALFQGADTLMHESGIAAVVAAGAVVGNVRAEGFAELREFKEQLTTLFIAMLFVLLAAGVRVADVVALGWGGVATVAALMFIVRPANVWISTLGDKYTARERHFMCWLAPRGIVAAAVSSFFAVELELAGIAGGESLQGLVFLVIAVTVVLQGLTAGPVARFLGLTLPTDNGYVVLGANALARAVAAPLRDAGEDVVLIDTDSRSINIAEQAGFRVVFGSGLAESVQLRAELSSRKGALAVTRNDATNLLFLQAARRAKVHNLWASFRPDSKMDAALREHEGVKMLFGRPVDVPEWIHRLERGSATVELWEAAHPTDGALTGAEHVPGLLVLNVQEVAASRVADETENCGQGDKIWVAITNAQREEIELRLQEVGLAPVRVE